MESLRRKQQDISDIRLSQLMCDSRQGGDRIVCGANYSGCVLRSSGVLFERLLLLQEVIFFTGRESSRIENYNFTTQASTFESWVWWSSLSKLCLCNFGLFHVCTRQAMHSHSCKTSRHSSSFVCICVGIYTPEFHSLLDRNAFEGFKLTETQRDEILWGGVSLSLSSSMTHAQCIAAG